MPPRLRRLSWRSGTEDAGRDAARIPVSCLEVRHRRACSFRKRMRTGLIAREHCCSMIEISGEMAACDWEDGRVVATCLMRQYQPLIRFRLGDLAGWAGSPCSCGRRIILAAEVTRRVENMS